MTCSWVAADITVDADAGVGMTRDATDAAAGKAEDAADAGVDTTKDDADAGAAIAGGFFLLDLPRVAPFPEMAFSTAFFAAASFNIRVLATGLVLAPVARLEGISTRRRGEE